MWLSYVCNNGKNCDSRNNTRFHEYVWICIAFVLRSICIFSCCLLHLGMRPKHLTMATIYGAVLWFQADHCTLLICDLEQVTIALHSMFLNINQSCVLTALFSCYMTGTIWNCCYLGACSVYTTIQPCTTLQCHFLWSNMRRVHVCLAVTCGSHFEHNNSELGSFMYYCGNMGVKQISKYIHHSTESRPGRK